MTFVSPSIQVSVTDVDARVFSPAAHLGGATIPIHSTPEGDFYFMKKKHAKFHIDLHKHKDSEMVVSVIGPCEICVKNQSETSIACSPIIRL